QKVILRGYTDDTAARENNLKLSQRRCDAIAAMLTALDVDGGQILTEPLGEANPVATNDTPEGRRLNRRVVISIQE
ncbi:MAG TPA: OmpA family protein, partial [Bacteroidia bacterium]|nr:OmpA family protein [Bacteroidia bacterium]